MIEEHAAIDEASRVAFLAEASHTLASSLDVGETLGRVASLVVPRFADWCVVHLLRGEQLEPVAIQHADPDRVEAAWASQRRLGTSMASPYGPAAVIRTGEPELTPELTPELIDALPDAERRESVRAAGLRSAMVAPLTARGAVVGTFTFASTRDDLVYTEDDLLFAVDLGRRAGAAIDTARLVEARERSLDYAARLQRVAAQLGGAVRRDEVLAIVLDAASDACGAAAALVALPAGGAEVEVAGQRGYGAAAIEGWARFELTDRVPAGRAILTGAGVYCSSRAERDALFPEIAGVGVRPSHALAALPLPAAGGAAGALVLSFAGEHEFGEDERLFLETLAAQSAQALERARLFEQVEGSLEAERAAAQELERLNREISLERETVERRADAASALEFVADGICLVDTAGAVRLWNEAATRITGVPADAVLGRLIDEAIPRWSELEPRIPVLPAGVTPPRPQTLPIELGGEERWLSISGVRFHGGAVFAFRDVTEERGLDAMKSDFIATVSHELRTPLSAVYGAASTLRNRSSLAPEEREQFLVMIEEQSERLAGIVNEILTASRIDSGEISVALTRVDGVAVVEDVLAVVRRGVGSGFRIDLRVDGAVPNVVANADRLRQVIANLVENAVKYSGDSRVVDVEVGYADARVRFAVRDYGIGIAPVEQVRIFEKFFRVDPAMSSGVSGTGLGLYIVRELVARMNGRIGVESARGGGSTFLVELPAT